MLVVVECVVEVLGWSEMMGTCYWLVFHVHGSHDRLASYIFQCRQCDAERKFSSQRMCNNIELWSANAR